MRTFFLAMLLIFLPGLAVFGQSSKSGNDTKPTNPSGQNYSPGSFVDNNNNGICDNFENRGGKGRGGNFVDADGDGICDRKAGKGYKQVKRGPYCQQGCRRATNPPCRGGRSK